MTTTEAQGPRSLTFRLPTDGDRSAELAEFERLDSLSETPVDRAWRAARSVEIGDDAAAADAEADAAAARLIDVLLAEPLICPVRSDAHDAPIEPALQLVEGVETLLLFDTEDRLAEYVEAPTPFVAAQGRAFFAHAATIGLPVALNPRVADSETVFTLETVRAIGELIEAADALASD